MLISALTMRDVALAVAWRMFGNEPRFWANVKFAVVESVSGLGSPAARTWVSVKLNDAPGARRAVVAELLPARAWTASASMLPNRLLVNVLLGLFVSSTRPGLSAELVLVIV